MIQHLLMLLAATPAAQAPAPPPADPLTPLYYLVGSTVVLQLLALGGKAVQWLASKVVQREDEDKKAMNAALKKHDDRFDELDDTINEASRGTENVARDMENVTKQLNTIVGQVGEVKAAVEKRTVEQGQYYRDAVKEFEIEQEKKLKDLEYKLRQDMARAVADSLREKK